MTKSAGSGGAASEFPNKTNFPDRRKDDTAPSTIDRTDHDWLTLLTEEAKRHYSGHFTVMRFSTNWRVGFGTPNANSLQQLNQVIAEMQCGQTFAEAAQRALQELWGQP